ncbi:3D domain-containing protein [Heyndrickxia coagulans]|nr:3D domain-containing protein [Heyndrickxia coagulans]UZH07283.1 3D domain-containing protein [Heyndrickxia coagulans]
MNLKKTLVSLLTVCMLSIGTGHAFAVTTSSYRTMTVKATAYTAGSGGGITATGINLKRHPSAKVIAVDPKVIRLGSKVYVPGYGMAVAGDTGGAIKGKKIDVFISSKKKALQWGRKTVTIKVYK